MTALDRLAEAMFPTIDKTPEEYEALYPPRQLPEGARVTRIAPSPTGYLHIGTLYMAMIDRLTASTPGSVFYVRLEDTDKKREMEGGADDILAGLNHYGLTIDEGFVAPGRSGGLRPYSRAAGRRFTSAMSRSWSDRVWPIPASALRSNWTRCGSGRKRKSSAPATTAPTPPAGIGRRRRRWRKSARPALCGAAALPGQRGAADQIRRPHPRRDRNAGKRSGHRAAEVRRHPHLPLRPRGGRPSDAHHPRHPRGRMDRLHPHPSAAPSGCWASSRRNTSMSAPS